MDDPHVRILLCKIYHSFPKGNLIPFILSPVQELMSWNGYEEDLILTELFI